VSSLLRSLGILLGSGLVISALVSACDDEPQETLCDSGENIFCRCPGGEAGTKECQDDGESFGECFIDPATLCGERVECIEGEFVVCACPSGDIGQKECLRDEDGYGPCMLDSGEPCPFGTGPGATGPGGGGVGGMGEGGGTVGCAHGLCDNGDPLTADCDACAAAVCAADDYCCTQAWDSICVGLVDSECDNLCNPITECAHDPCVTGVALDSSCDPCVSTVCAARRTPAARARTNEPTARNVSSPIGAPASRSLA